MALDDGRCAGDRCHGNDGSDISGIGQLKGGGYLRNLPAASANYCRIAGPQALRTKRPSSPGHTSNKLCYSLRLGARFALIQDATSVTGMARC